VPEARRVRPLPEEARQGPDRAVGAAGRSYTPTQIPMMGRPTHVPDPDPDATDTDAEGVGNGELGDVLGAGDVPSVGVVLGAGDVTRLGCYIVMPRRTITGVG
jgi:hypothetical protein